MKTTNRTIKRTNGEYIMTSEAWWLANFVKMENGKIEIARVEAKKEDGIYLLSLTEEDLIENNITPGDFESAWNNIYLPTNKPEQKIITQKEHDHNMFMLETEGCGYGEEIKDNTPYMKSDDNEF